MLIHHSVKRQAEYMPNKIKSFNFFSSCFRTKRHKSILMEPCAAAPSIHIPTLHRYMHHRTKMY